MGEGRYLWQKYCSFFDQDFEEQLQYNFIKRDHHFSQWKKSRTAESLSSEIDDFEDIPLTGYEDYPILHKFGEKLEKLSQTIPRENGELSWEYYQRISKQVAPLLEDWLPDDYEFCGKTTGSTGKSKWFAYGRIFKENLIMDSVSLAIIGCSDKSGTTRIDPGDNLLNILAPAPYIAGTSCRAWAREFELVPTIKEMESTSNMIKKINLIVEKIKDGKRIDGFGGIASPLKMICDYLKNPGDLYKEYYRSVNFGILKFALFFKYLKEKYFGTNHKKLKNILPLKGIGTAGIDTKLYYNYLKREFGLKPLNGYGNSEFGMVMYGRPEIKKYLVPSLRSCYFEFLDEKGQIRKIDELQKGQLYEFVGTGFGSMLSRYKTGDIFRVVDIRKDGMPILDCEGRKRAWLDFYDYFRISQRLITDAIIESGLDGNEKWCVYKKINPREKLCVLMEKLWDYDRVEATRKLFDALKKISNSFNDYIVDFKINDPERIIEVEYLSRGSFMRYTMKKKKEGVPLGQIKVPKIISAEDKELINFLRNI